MSYRFSSTKRPPAESDSKDDGSCRRVAAGGGGQGEDSKGAEHLDGSSAEGGEGEEDELLVMASCFFENVGA